MKIKYRLDKCFITCGEFVSEALYTFDDVEVAVDKAIEFCATPNKDPHDYDYFYEIQVIYEKII